MKAMNKSKALDRLSVFFWFVFILIFVNASIWFGSVSYFVLSGVFMLMGAVGMASCMACHNGLKSPRFAYYAIVFAGGSIFMALPFA